MTASRTIPIACPSMGEEEWQAVRQALESGMLVQGPRVKALEEAFARRHRVRHAVATSNCTTALHLALLALGIGPGDEVIVPAFTWVATANAVVYTGATPVFVDVCEDTFNIDPGRISASLSPRTKAIVPVHLFGLPADLPALRRVLPPPHVRIVEDAACAAGAALHGTPAGALGDIGCFSFHPRKSVTTGEGGMIVTDDDALAARARILRNHGLSESPPGQALPPYFLADVEVLGFNYRLTDPQAALGLVQLGKLDGFIAERDRWARWYTKELGDLAWLQTPHVPEGYEHAWQAYVTVVAEDAPIKRNDLMVRLHALGIATRPGTQAVTELAYYRRSYGLRPGQFPVAARLLAQSMAIPLHNAMTPDDYHYVVEALRGVAGAAA